MILSLRYILLIGTIIILLPCFILGFIIPREKIDYNNSAFIQASCNVYNNLAKEGFYIRYRDSDQYSVIYYKNSDRSYQPYVPSEDLQKLVALGAVGFECYKPFGSTNYALFIYDTLSLSVEEGCMITSKPLCSNPKYLFLWENNDCYAYSFR